MDVKPTTTAAVKRRVFAAWSKQAAQTDVGKLATLAGLCVYDGQKNIFAPRDLQLGKEGALFDVQLNDDPTEK